LATSWWYTSFLFPLFRNVSFFLSFSVDSSKSYRLFSAQSHAHTCAEHNKSMMWKNLATTLHTCDYCNRFKIPPRTKSFVKVWLKWGYLLIRTSHYQTHLWLLQPLQNPTQNQEHCESVAKVRLYLLIHTSHYHTHLWLLQLLQNPTPDRTKRIVQVWRMGGLPFWSTRRIWIPTTVCNLVCNKLQLGQNLIFVKWVCHKLGNASYKL